MPKYQSVSNLLSHSGTRSDSHLQSLLERAQYLQSLTRVLREHIDPVLSDHITVVNIRRDSAIVAADSPAWLSKIRYLSPVILQILQEQAGLMSINNIQFKVQPSADSETRTQVSRHATLSASSSKILESAASGARDPKLAEVLQRLSQKGKT